MSGAPGVLKGKKKKKAVKKNLIFKKPSSSRPSSVQLTDEADPANQIDAQN